MISISIPNRRIWEITDVHICPKQPRPPIKDIIEINVVSIDGLDSLGIDQMICSLFECRKPQ